MPLHNERFRYLVLPRLPWRRRPRYWLRPVAALVLAAGGVAAIAVVVTAPAPPAPSDPRCSPPDAATNVWRSADGECVGFTDGTFDFDLPHDLPDYGPVLARIHEQNLAAGSKTCVGHAAPVKVGVLVTLSAQNAVGRALHQMEGYAVAQDALNEDGGCVRPVQLVVGQIGAGNYPDEVKVATALAHDGVVAMVGMGLSDVQTAAAANAVGALGVPMVADLATAEGFDANGSALDPHRDFSSCRDADQYSKGIGGGWFFRVGYRNAVQVARLANYGHPPTAPTRGAAASTARPPADFLVVPLDKSDPATCTQIPDYRTTFQPTAEFPYDHDTPGTLDDIAHEVCRVHGDVVLVYGARGVDLARFLNDLDARAEQYHTCDTHITILEGSDASRLRAREADPTRERERVQALSSASFRSGKIRLLYASLATPGGPQAVADSPTFANFRTAFVARYAEEDLDDGWALNAHDALTVVHAALQVIAPGEPQVNGARVRSVIATRFQSEQVLGAIAPGLQFDAFGNTRGTPQVVRLCPIAGPGARTIARPVDPGRTDVCPA